MTAVFIIHCNCKEVAVPGLHEFVFDYHVKFIRKDSDEWYLNHSALSLLVKIKYVNPKWTKLIWLLEIKLIIVWGWVNTLHSLLTFQWPSVYFSVHALHLNADVAHFKHALRQMSFALSVEISYRVFDSNCISTVCVSLHLSAHCYNLLTFNHYFVPSWSFFPVKTDR